MARLDGQTAVSGKMPGIYIYLVKNKSKNQGR